VVYFWKAVRQRNFDRALIAAIKNNNDRTVKRLLALGANSNSRDTADDGRPWWDVILDRLRSRRSFSENGEPALAIAMTVSPDEKPEILTALIECGAKVNVPNAFGEGGVVYWAICHHDASLVSVALAHGANPSAQIPNDGTVLTEAILNGEGEIARILLGRGADPNGRDMADRGGGGTFAGDWNYSREPALVCAMGSIGMSRPDRALIVKLLDHCADINAADDDGHTALMCAICESGDYDTLIPLLLARGASVNCRDKSGVTTLEFAYARQRAFQNGRLSDATARCPHLRYLPDTDTSDATKVIQLLRQAGAKQ
jgi:ankyrin repeat protein